MSNAIPEMRAAPDHLQERSGRWRVRLHHAVPAMCFLDFLAVGAPGAAGIVGVRRIFAGVDLPPYAPWWCAATLSSVLLFAAAGCYRALPSDLRSQLPRLVAAFSLSILLVTFLLFSLKIGNQYSRGWIIGWWATGSTALLLNRFFAERARRHLLACGHLNESIAVFGAGEPAQRMIPMLRRCEGVEIIGVFDDRRSRVPGEVGGVHVIGGATELAVMAQALRIDRIVIALPFAALDRIRQIAKIMYALPLRIDVALDTGPYKVDFRRGRRMGDVLLLEMHDRPIAEWRYLMKACEDKILSIAALLVAAPLMVAIGALIKLDSPGPVFFRQPRYGYGGRIFEVLKFRTMYSSQADALGEQLTRPHDPRVTRVGRWLRRSSLDELPQFINVLQGDMSMVGPRPHPLRAKAADILYEEVLDRYALRHRVKPGITGWAQVQGWRGETKTLAQLQSRVECDLFYIENWSLWLDIRILMMTVAALFRKNNAF